MSAALVLAFRLSAGATVAAFAGAWLLRASGYSPVSARGLMFWAIAVMLVVSIDVARRGTPQMPARLRYFIVGGSLAGMAAGLSFHQAGAIVGSAAGAILGALAFMGVSKMRDIPRLSRWVIAAGLPSVVTMSLISLGLEGLLTH